MTLVQALIGLVGILAATASGYFIAKRTSSGTIDTSNAESLWKESGEIRRELAAQATYWREQWTITQAELATATRRIAELEKQLGRTL